LESSAGEEGSEKPDDFVGVQEVLQKSAFHPDGTPDISKMPIDPNLLIHVAGKTCGKYMFMELLPPDFNRDNWYKKNRKHG
jgi:hypothetical protein